MKELDLIFSNNHHLSYKRKIHPDKIMILQPIQWNSPIYRFNQLNLSFWRKEEFISSGWGKGQETEDLIQKEFSADIHLSESTILRPKINRDGQDELVISTSPLLTLGLNTETIMVVSNFCSAKDKNSLKEFLFIQRMVIIIKQMVGTPLSLTGTGLKHCESTVKYF
jgi:hypothetical protein